MGCMLITRSDCLASLCDGRFRYIDGDDEQSATWLSLLQSVRIASSNPIAAISTLPPVGSIRAQAEVQTRGPQSAQGETPVDHSASAALSATLN